MSSLVCLYYHIVFSTKDRALLLTPTLRERLWPYLGGIIRDQGGIALAVGGTADHVHVLARLAKDRTIPDVLRELKGSSSHWVHEMSPELSFGWQAGYAAFTVGVRGVPQVQAYIARQEEHHWTTTFQDELRAFLDQHGIEYDERYLWG